MMTKKHYIEIADILKNTEMPSDILKTLVMDFSDFFERDNPNFNSELFENLPKFAKHPKRTEKNVLEYKHIVFLILAS